jgi:hypothetical protein
MAGCGGPVSHQFLDTLDVIGDNDRPVLHPGGRLFDRGGNGNAKAETRRSALIGT